MKTLKAEFQNGNKIYTPMQNVALNGKSGQTFEVYLMQKHTNVYLTTVFCPEPVSRKKVITLGDLL